MWIAEAYTGPMSDSFDIYFGGKIMDGFEEGSVRESVAKMFKANQATVEKLFSGKPQLIKRGVDRKTAIKYKTALEKAGAVPLIRAGAQPRAAPPLDDNLPSSSEIPAAAPSAPESGAAEKEPAAKSLAERLAP